MNHAQIFSAIHAAHRPGRWLRFRADLFSLGYLALASAALLAHALHGQVLWWLVPIHCALAYGCGCIQHGQAHTPMWTHAVPNALTDLWIAMLRGDGPWSWKPTHVANHHRFANRDGDFTLTTRYGSGMHLAGWIAYTCDGTLRYVKAGWRYLVEQTRRGPRHGGPLLQFLAVIALHAWAWSRDPSMALALLLIPQGFGVLAMIATGYPQHHHALLGSPWQHARDFTGWFTNLLHFNHGLHTVHHVDPTLHWSQWPAAHRLAQPLLHPRLQEKNLPWFLLRSMVLAWFMPSFRSTSLNSPASTMT